MHSHNCTSTCNISDIAEICFCSGPSGNSSAGAVETAAGLFWADGCLCVLFALATHFKYTRVTVLNYSVCTPATSNMHWISFFIFTALSSIMSGVNLWMCANFDDVEKYAVITAWFANLFSVLALVFAVKYQWKYRERAYDDIATTSVGETTPILSQQNGTASLLRPSKADVFFVILFLLSGGLFAAACAWKRDWHENVREAFFWAAHSFVWLLQVVIFVMILIIHRTVTQEGTTVMVKRVLLAGVIFNALSDIPTYIWMNCILESEGTVYAVLVGLILLSHVAFFFVVRSEFQRLRDVAIWNLIDKMDTPQLQTSN